MITVMTVALGSQCFRMDATDWSTAELTGLRLMYESDGAHVAILTLTAV